MNIIITGGNSQVGKILCRDLQKSHKITTAGRSGCDLVFDLNDNSTFSQIRDFDLVIHCAHSYSGQKIDNIDLNLLAAQELFAICETLPNTRVMFISSNSAHVYSRSQYGRIKGEIEVLSKKFSSVESVRLGFVCDEQFSNKLVLKALRIARKMKFLVLPYGEKLLYRRYTSRQIILALQIPTVVEERQIWDSLEAESLSLHSLLSAELRDLGFKGPVFKLPLIFFKSPIWILYFLMRLGAIESHKIDPLLSLLPAKKSK